MTTKAAVPPNTTTGPPLLNRNNRPRRSPKGKNTQSNHASNNNHSTAAVTGSISVGSTNNNTNNNHHPGGQHSSSNNPSANESTRPRRRNAVAVKSEGPPLNGLNATANATRSLHDFNYPSRAEPRSSAAYRLFDPKKDPVLTVSSSAAALSASPGAPRGNRAAQEAPNPSPNQGHTRQKSMQDSSSHSRLYDPRREPQQAPVRPYRPPPPQPQDSAPAAKPTHNDILLQLTKKVQDLETVVMARPGRRSLDSDDEKNRKSQGPQAWVTRIESSKRLASMYLKLIQYDYRFAIKNDLDTRCWKVAFYPLIESFRTAIRDEQEAQSCSDSEDDDEVLHRIRTQFAGLVQGAQDFYKTLQTTLQKFGSAASLSTSTPGQQTQESTLPLKRVAQAPPRWYRCVGIQGDLARYRWLHRLYDPMEPNKDWLVVARQYYREAIDLGPGNGKMYNQLALLAGDRGLKPLYYFSKSLTVKAPYINAREALISHFARNEVEIRVQAMALGKTKAHKDNDVATIQDIETTHLWMQSMIFSKINLEEFDPVQKNLLHLLGTAHTQTNKEESIGAPINWNSLYFMLAVVNVAGLYEYNWASSVIAKSSSAVGSMEVHLGTVATLPYSSKVLFSVMEQTMHQYLLSVDHKRAIVSSWTDQEGWLIYCHVILSWMAGHPLGVSQPNDMVAAWLTMVDMTTFPTFWTTLIKFMNHHWTCLKPFDQTDLLANLTVPDSDDEANQQLKASTLPLSGPPLSHEWELRGLAWVPSVLFSGPLFKGSRPTPEQRQLAQDQLWQSDSTPMYQYSKRIAELALVTVSRMGLLEFDYCENEFKLTVDMTEHIQDTQQEQAASSHQDEEYFVDERHLVNTSSTSDDSDIDLNTEEGQRVFALKSKRDRLQAMMSSAATTGADGDSEGHFGRRSDSRQRVSSHGRQQPRKRNNNNNNNNSSIARVRDNSVFVIDTNCLVSDWTLFQKLIEADRWLVVVPLVVITELDGLCNNPPPLGPAAQSALSYLEGCFAKGARRPLKLKIQTSRGNYMPDLSYRVESFDYDKDTRQRKQQDYEDGDSSNMMEQKHTIDDFILGICLWHQEQALLKQQQQQQGQQQQPPQQGSSSSTVVPEPKDIYLVTDDRNLRVKARFRQMDVLDRGDIGRIVQMATTSKVG